MQLEVNEHGLASATEWHWAMVLPLTQEAGHPLQQKEKHPSSLVFSAQWFRVEEQEV